MRPVRLVDPPAKTQHSHPPSADYCAVEPNAHSHPQGVGGQGEVSLTYELAVLADAANARLYVFVDRYPAFLQSRERAIAPLLTQRPEV
jgi:hypothetical protein